MKCEQSDLTAYPSMDTLFIDVDDEDEDMEVDEVKAPSKPDTASLEKKVDDVSTLELNHNHPTETIENLSSTNDESKNLSLLEKIDTSITLSKPIHDEEKLAKDRIKESPIISSSNQTIPREDRPKPKYKPGPKSVCRRNRPSISSVESSQSESENEENDDVDYLPEDGNIEISPYLMSMMQVQYESVTA